MTPEATPTVLHVITSLQRGGAERTLLRLVDRLSGGSDARQVVVTLSPGGAFEEAVAATGTQLLTLHLRPGRPSLAAVLRLVRILRAVQPTVTVSWLYHADLVATLAHPFARGSRLVWNLRGTRKEATSTARTTRVVVWLLARLSRHPWAVAANSHAGRRDHEELGYRPRRWVHLPNGFSATEWYPDQQDRADVRRELGLATDDLAVIMVGRAHPQKDHRTLLDAAGRFLDHGPQVRLVLIGPGVEQLAVPGALAGRVLLLGARDDVPRLLRAADVAVLSSAYGEGLPNVIGEAMLTELPCVVTDVGDAGVLVGDTGHVVPPQDPAALAVAVERLLSAGPEERQRLGRAARARVVQRYSIDAMAHAYRGLWQDPPDASAPGHPA